MELPLFEQVAELIRALIPEDPRTGGSGSRGRSSKDQPESERELRVRAHRRGVKVWFSTAKPPKEHYEAQLMSRPDVDGRQGMALEIGFHLENRDAADNEQALALLVGSEKSWRKILGSEAQAGEFFGGGNWRRISEAWIEPDLEDPELSFEIASRLVDYLVALEPVRT